MGPAMGPTTALALCAAAFVGWRAPVKPAQNAKPETYEVPEPTSTDDLDDREMHAAGINNSSDPCESTPVPVPVRQPWNVTSKTISANALEFPDESIGDCAMTQDRENEITFAQNGMSLLLKVPILVDIDSSQHLQKSNMRADGDGLEFLMDSNHDGAILHYTEVCPQFETCPVPNVNGSEPSCSLPLCSAESREGLLDNEFGNLNEFAATEAEVVAEMVVEPTPDTFDDLDIPVLLWDSAGLEEDITAASRTQVPLVKQDVAEGWIIQGFAQSSNLRSMFEKFCEFGVLSWQVCCKECRKMISDDMLDSASRALQQKWHACLATSQSVLGEDLFKSVSDWLAQWWKVALMCFASFCDLVLFGVFGRFIFGKVVSVCCRGRRTKSLSGALSVAEALPSDEPNEVVQSHSNGRSLWDTVDKVVEHDLGQESARSSSGTPQMTPPRFGDVQCGLACEGGSVESAIKGQRSPFNSAIQVVRNIPTPVRRVVAGQPGFASGQHMVADSVSVS